MGNPHAVQVVEDVDTAPVRTQGPLIENHPDFPRRVNAGYMQVVSRSRIRLRVWERGAGRRSPAARGRARRGRRAFAWASSIRPSRSRRAGRPHDRVAGPTAPVMMTGDAVRVFDGEIEI
jgi:diaminopimelate epimerase